MVMGEDNKIEIKMDIVGDLDHTIFLDRFQVLMNKEAFNYQLVICLSYLFSKHTRGYFRMMHLHYVLSKHMENLMHSKDSIDYFLPYSLEALSAMGFVEAKEINGKQFQKISHLLKLLFCFMYIRMIIETSLAYNECRHTQW